MAEADKSPDDGAENAPQKKSWRPLALGLVLALAGGGGGFYATYSGLFPGGDSREPHEAETQNATHDGHASMGDMPDIAFVPVSPMIVSLGAGTQSRHLRFRAQLEVPSQYQADVEKLLPRVVDVLNSYLRALELSDIADAAALVRLRAQMLRRVQIVTGTGRVNDLLIMEFVLN